MDRTYFRIRRLGDILEIDEPENENFTARLEGSLTFDDLILIVPGT